jgi:phosphatidylglycerol:prolipoprotein diacylglycerol transferase
VNLVINWDVSPEIIDGWRTPNLYGLLFVTGLIIGYFVVKRMFKKEQIDDKQLDSLVLYMIISIIVGARLGHVLFYGPYWDFVDVNGHKVEGYFSHPVSIIKVWEGGLASHGAAISILLALWYYSRKVVKKPYLWILDRIAAPIAIAGCFIRLGNLVNHEIVGDVSNLPWAFSFSMYYDEATNMFDPTPRHPAQLYEAIAYLFSFGFLYFLYWKKEGYLKPGLVFGAFLILIFGSRFLVEFIKLGQTARDFQFSINTGQILSIPLILTGIYLVYKALYDKVQDSTRN